MRIINLATTPQPIIFQTTIHHLKQGHLIVYPTETCYGLGADATNPQAINRLLSFKGNRQGKAISIAVANQAMAEQYVSLNSTARHLYRHFLPGPITVISVSKGKVAPQLQSPQNTLGIRIPDYPLILNLISAFGKPITATSANASGYKQPYSLADFTRYNPQRALTLVSLFLDAGPLPHRLPSTVVDTTLNDPHLVRQGSLVLPHSPTFTSHSPQETITLAQKIITPHLPLLKTHPLLIALQGNLGAGKTHFVKGIAQALGITTPVKSPTYTLINEYPLPNSNNYLYHLDTWRLTDPDEFFTTLHFDKLLQPGNLIAIEWLEKIKSHLDKLSRHYPILWLKIDITSPTTRRLTSHFTPPST